MTSSEPRADRSSIRIAYFSNFSPQKLGTGENRIVAFAAAARARGHRFTLFGRKPVHPDVRVALREAGARWEPLSRLESTPVRSSRRLAREFDVLQLNMIAPRSRLALAAYLAWPARVLFVDRVSGEPGGPPSRGFVRRIADRLTMVRVDELAGITDYVRQRAQARFGLPAARTRVLYNGVDVERFHPPAREPEERPFRVLTVANLIPEKGVDVLLEAMAMVSVDDWRLRVAGAGPEEPELRRLAEDFGIESRTRFLGLRDDVPELLRTSHVFVHAAVWQEALGNTVLEGMATGRPVIASRVGGIPELIQDGEEGLLVGPGDVEGIAAALESLAENAERRRRLGAEARKRVLRDFRLEDSIARHLDWCEEVSLDRPG
ncbi:MAG: glycosyltransferase [Gemmatimonadota bacterium]